MKRDFLQLKAGYLHRERLDNLLSGGMSYPLISVVAGPGYGKTLAVAGYALRTPMRLIWLRLQQTDSDIYRLWAHFTEAVGRELPDLAEQLKKTALPALLGIYDAIIQLFAQELEGGRPILMVLDNFEYVASSQFFEFLQLLVKAELAGLHVVVISNEKLSFGAMAPSGGQLRISMEDLSFTNEEIGDLFLIHGMAATQEEVGAIAQSTGRWPLALHLVCINKNGDHCDILKEKTHQQLAAELFAAHYFYGYDQALQLLLVKLACFPRFPLELVDRLTESDAARFVDELSRNVFISYDYTLELFQFQTMYRSFLNYRQALIPEEQKHAMYAFMGGWYLEHGYYYEALDCFWHNRDYDSYLNTVYMLPRVRRSTSAAAEILSCLEQFPKEYARANPALDLCRAVLLMGGLQLEKSRGLLLGLLERLEGEHPPKHPQLLGDACVALADLSLLLNRDDSLPYIKKAAEYLPGGSGVHSRDTLPVGNNSVFYLPDGGPGQLRRMEEYFFLYARYADPVLNGSGYGFEWLFAAQAAFLSEQFDRARECCFQAIAKARLMDQHDIICNAYWELIRTELFMGDWRQGQRWLDELVNYVDSRRLADLYELRDCAVSWFYLRMGDPDRVAPWVKSAAPLRPGNILETGRNRIIIIYYLSELGRLGEACAEITRLEDIFQKCGRWQEKNLLLIHKAIRLLELKQKKAAVIAFKQAYDMVYSNDIAAILAEFGKLAQRLVRAATAQTDISFDAHWLEKVYKKAGSFDKRAASVKKAYRQENMPPESADFNLNARETQILTYIAQGMTRPEIAQLMDTSLSNVKRYINSIYTKLGALNRADAIHIATLNGILGKGE